MPAAPRTALERTARTLAGLSPQERRSLLDEADRLRRSQHSSSNDLGRHVNGARSGSVARLAKALSDPVRVGLLDAVRGADGEVCQCDLQPLFDISQPTLSHHLAKLVDAGLLIVRRRGRWAYYSTEADGLEALRTWLTPRPARGRLSPQRAAGRDRRGG